MTKIFKHLAKHWAACLVIIALLLVQAYGDLTLPDYTSKIVDTDVYKRQLPAAAKRPAGLFGPVRPRAGQT